MGKNKKETPSRPAPKPTPSPVQPCRCTITSETKATSPEDRARTRIAVGEEVTLTVSPGPADWAITSGTGGLVDDNGRVANVSSITFTADDNGGSATKSVTITATCSCGTCTITFTVVAPSHWTIRREARTVLKHTKGRPDCGFLGRPFIHPNDVNFYNIYVREKDSTGTGDGAYGVYTGSWHGWYPEPDRVSNVKSIPIDDHTSNHGSRVDATDRIGGLDPGTGATGVAPPFNPGRLIFPMVWQWRFHYSDDWHDFPTQNQHHAILETGECESTKGWHTESTQYQDDDGSPF